VRTMTDEPAWYRVDCHYRLSRHEGHDRLTAFSIAILAPFVALAMEKTLQNVKREKERVKQREQWRLEAQEEYEQGECDES